MVSGVHVHVHDAPRFDRVVVSDVGRGARSEYCCCTDHVGQFPPVLHSSTKLVLQSSQTTFQTKPLILLIEQHKDL